MNGSIKCLISALAVSLPSATSAQSTDAKYCSDLSEKYERYLSMNASRGGQPQSLDAKVAVQKCASGDTAYAIPILEKALKNARLDLPPRT